MKIEPTVLEKEDRNLNTRYSVQYQLSEDNFFSATKIRTDLPDKSEKGKHIECNICDYSCYKKGHLKTHIESVHENKKSHKCSFCDFSSSHKRSLKMHVESVHDSKRSNI